MTNSGKAIMFPTTWGGPALPLRPFKPRDGADIVKMLWIKGRFTITYEDGQTWTRLTYDG